MEKTNYNSFVRLAVECGKGRGAEKIIPFVKIDCTLSIKNVAAAAGGGAGARAGAAVATRAAGATKEKKMKHVG